MRHPIDWISEEHGLRWIKPWQIAVLAFGAMLVLGPKAWPPATPLTPNRILELELAGTRDGVLTLLRAFDGESNRTRTDFRAEIRRSIFWDFGFIASYSIFLAVLI
jgi:hypothetical protein